MSGDVVERAKAFTDAFAEPGNAWRMEARQLIIELAAEVERLRPFSRCPRCSSMRTRSMDHWEEPTIVCDDCGYGT
ncbi:hypothetical protein [Mycolicibacterium mucogenicum]|uniref:Uncharacterized protein n=1 Tax=Mycolicibacterium mucogenicum DSM 44124 TaxID=1226753 RepID=A0A8H2J8W8_MYCMU|nr:hypothetical protein [Mycolicibacterium mucogenicum]KAB7761773.1 hypothetical protein MMUC44124_00990 [Mycolicibacterium mucogenicum DSM 44124]QPG70006.1 hypothetical protein C1S78_002970 [Mycolicibacterium mucogenicum DSM 44124]